MSALAAAALFAGPAKAALQDRDLDGNGVTDAFYDTDLNITWLRNANLNGLMTWDQAVAWAGDFSFGGYSDWRLPTSDSCETYNCTGSEMGHLWYVELGNTPTVPMTNRGNFQNLLSSAYWSGTEHELYPDYGRYFVTFVGSQWAIAKWTSLYAMAVRPGDVTPVPEPQTYALLMLGLGALALARRLRV